MTSWKLTLRALLKPIARAGQPVTWEAIKIAEEAALEAQKRLVKWLLEEGYLYSARDEGSQEEGLLLPMEDWQALCKELGVKDA